MGTTRLNNTSNCLIAGHKSVVANLEASVPGAELRELLSEWGDQRQLPKASYRAGV